MRKLLIAAIILLSLQNLLAQDSLKVLNEVIVSAARTEQEIINSARTVEVIDEETIKSSSFNSVGELLSSKSSLFVVGATQTPGTNQDVFIRGANSNHIAVLIDGVRVTDPSSPNSSFNLSELSLANVERIEIVYGPHSTLYGTAAIGGVVNIITKKGKLGFSGLQSVKGGVFKKGNLLENSTYLSYGFENGFYLSGSAFHQRVNGIDASVDTVTASYKTADNDDFRKTDVSLKLGYNDKSWDGFIEAKKANQEADIDDGAFNDDDNYTLDLDRSFINYGLKFKKERITIELNGGYTTAERKAVNDSSAIDSIGTSDRTYFSSLYTGDVFTNELLLKYRTDRVTLITGFGNYSESMGFNTFYYSNSEWGEFQSIVNYDSMDLIADIKHGFISGIISPFGDRGLKINFGTRYNHHSSFGSHFTYELSPSFSFIENTLLFFSYAKGFNAPSLYQMYDPTPRADGKTRGNEHLDPEKSRSMELGWKHYVTPEIAYTVSVFNNKVEDAIEYVYLWNGNTPKEALSFMDYLGDTYINVAEQDVKGIEFTINALLLKRLSLHANFTALDAKLTNTSALDTAVVGQNHVQVYSNGVFVGDRKENQELIRRPSVLLHAGAGYIFNKKLQLNIDIQHIGGRNDAVYDSQLGPYGALGAISLKPVNLIHMSAGYDFTDRLSANLSVRNVLKEEFQEINGFNSIRRSFYLKLNYSF